MDELTASQVLLWRAIRWPTGVADFLAQADDDTRAEFARTFAQTPAFDRAARVSVYAEAYFWRLHGVLVDHFPLLAALLGRPRFHNLVTDYVLACPPVDPDIRTYGARLAAFVAAHAVAETITDVAEVAALDWAMVQALDRPQTEPLGMADLAAVELSSWPELRLRTVESAALLPLHRDPQALFAMATGGESAPMGSARTALVWRAGFAVQTRVVTHDEARALTRLLGGARFVELCDDPGLDPPTVAGWIASWVADGVLAGR